jgi:dolichyl-phosphate beta-glucosyltransferase
LAKPFLSVVIPAFNEQARIASTLEKLVGYLGRQQYSWEVVVADDGSSDRTAALVDQWASELEVVRLKTLPHGGKGWAVKHGMLEATGEYRFMCDADLAMPVEQLAAFLERMAEGYDIVIGSRQIAGARRFNEPPMRHVMGRLFNWAVRLLAVGRFQDTQCGFKCFKGKVAEELFRLQQTKGFGFDVEVLYLALKRDMRVLEMPIDWHHQRDSKVRAGVDSLAMLRDTLLIRWRDLRGKYGKHKAKSMCENSRSS